MPPRVTAQQRADIVRMLRNGSAFYITAEECGVDTHTVGRIARELGITPPARWAPRTLRAVELVRGGMSYNEAARVLDMDMSHVSRACHRLGVQSPYLTGGKRRAAA